MSTFVKTNFRKTAFVGALTLCALSMSGAASADRYWRGHGHGHHHHRHHGYAEYYAPVVLERHYYVQPQPVYVAPPVIYQTPVYQQYYSVPSYRTEYGGGNRLLSSAVLGAAGGYLGSQMGHGSERAAATAVGAVAGWVLGGNLGR
jgi:Glycine zipper 2TM domain